MKNNHLLAKFHGSLLLNLPFFHLLTWRRQSFNNATGGQSFFWFHFWGALVSSVSLPTTESENQQFHNHQKCIQNQTLFMAARCHLTAGGSWVGQGPSTAGELVTPGNDPDLWRN